MEIKIPDLGDADAVEVIELCVASGDTVGPDDALIVIESDKASMEVPAGASGTIERLVVSVGDTVAAGDVIATLVTTADSETAATVVDTPESETPVSETKETTPVPEPSPAAQSPSESAPAFKEIEVAVPDVGDADGVEVVEVSVSVGDRISVGDLLVILESDKASMEVPSDSEGEVIQLHTKVGDQVSQDSLLVTLRVATTSPGGEGSREVVAPKAQADADGQTQPKKPVAVAIPEPSQPQSVSGKAADVYAGPAVRRLARELGVDLTLVTGSGNNGRLVKEDVKAFVKGNLEAGRGPQGGIPPVPVQDYAKYGPVTTEPLGKIRELGAQNLHRSWLNVVHVTQHDDADITDLESFRSSLKAAGEAKGIKITPLAFIIKACCAALQEFPRFNSSLDEQIQHYILKQYYHIGFAVDTPQGLVVPVIKDADQKGIWTLSAEIVELAEKARNRKLSMNDMQGGTFSVSSLGAIGGTGFTPIVNAPEVAILGVGRTTMRPIWNGSEFTPAKMLPLSLSYDHRAINGAEAGRFVQRLTQLLGDVRQLVL